MTDLKLNPEVKEKWLAALRSGEYEQTKMTLRNNDGYCCLGVLCEVAVKEGVIEPAIARNEGTYHLYDDSDSALPYSVSKWAGLAFDEDAYEVDPKVAGKHLSEWNDSTGFNFDQIADLIEENL